MTTSDDALEAARRIVATDEGWPGANDEIDYLDAVVAARGLICCTSKKSPGLSLWRAVWLGIVIGVALAVLAFIVLVNLPVPTHEVRP